jgi:hypothetical protein
LFTVTGRDAFVAPPYSYRMTLGLSSLRQNSVTCNRGPKFFLHDKVILSIPCGMIGIIYVEKSMRAEAFQCSVKM